MKAKWLIVFFIASFTLLSIHQSQVFIPNQEIVLKFNKEVTFGESQHTIAALKEQLQSLGVHNIQLVEENDGALKITYYSDLEVSVVKLKLSECQRMHIGYTTEGNGKQQEKSSPSKEYNLDVYEIIEGADVDIAAKGYIPDIKVENNRSFTPKLYISYHELEVKSSCELFENRTSSYENTIVEINKSSFKIPEVRAGPIA